MKNLFLSFFRLGMFFLSFFFFGCEGGKDTHAFQEADSLNRKSYESRYKDLTFSAWSATEALQLGKDYPSIRAEALNNLAFCAFIQMDFERADSLLNEVYRETTNELECLVADVGMMKICQRTAMNKEFYDYRNSALRRMNRIQEDETALADARVSSRFNYACSEFSITSAIYYYYLQQEKQALEALREIGREEELEGDTAQLLFYYYMRGSGGMFEAKNPDDVVIGEFDYLMDCLMLSHEQGYVYFEANASQAMAELLKDKSHYELLLQKRPGMMRVVNRHDLPWEELILGFAENALNLFQQYGDWYQIAGTYRTMASCQNELGKHEQALENLTTALSYVNLHHEKFYHCQDTLDRLKPYVPQMTASTELKWINSEGIRTVPEWIARFREQLSVTYAALGMKQESDYNRNIYLDILDYTRQDKELESRYMALEEETERLNHWLIFVLLGWGILVVVMVCLNKRWRVRNTLYIEKLNETLTICHQITAAVPLDAEDGKDVVIAIMKAVKEKIMRLVCASDMEIVTGDELSQKSNKRDGLSFVLKSSEHELLGIWYVKMPGSIRKDERALLEVIVPYLAWTLENGLALISLTDERRRLDKERYVHELHLVENKRQNLIKKACLFMVNGITPYLDRLVNEVHKLTLPPYWEDKGIRTGKYRYIAELVHRINEYNDILALWIKMRQGSLKLNLESFELNSLFEVVQKKRRSFEAKQQTLSIESTDAIVKADKALTLFMINTLAENARKYTQPGGHIQVYAKEEAEYVEISVQDNGPGLSEEDVSCILNEKVYDSGKLGISTSSDVEALQKNKGSGFGLMNCRGIVEKYRKTNELFRVCCFCIESKIGQGSRFYFRLPKGVRRVWIWGVLLLLTACGQLATPQQEVTMSEQQIEVVMNDSLLHEANRLANRVYHANVEGRYQDALLDADRVLMCLNRHYLKHAEQVKDTLLLLGKEGAAELEWYEDHFDTDYYTLLDVRNEAAVAYLALGELEAYQYNNQAYTSLYKQISIDASLEEYCVRMRQSANNKLVAIILCIVLIVACLVGYYMLYLRHRLMYRYDLEQVLEVNRRALMLPAYGRKETVELASLLAEGIWRDVNELIPTDLLGIAVFNEEQQRLYHAFSSSERSGEDFEEAMSRCFSSGVLTWDAEKKCWCIPLCVSVVGKKCLVGVMMVHALSDDGREDTRIMLELVANYLAIIVYHAVELVAQKYRDIEMAQDEARRIVREENQLHVQNMVLDNCLSTIKHETIYYPNRVRQIVEHLQEKEKVEEERQKVEDMAELIAYYKDIFTMLCSCASRQLDEVTFKRSTVEVCELVEAFTHYFNRLKKKYHEPLDLKVKTEPVSVIGDAVLLKFLLENLLHATLIDTQQGMLELHVYKEGAFVRFDFIDRRRTLSQEELNQLFYPHLERMQSLGEGELIGVEYLISKQIVRDHDEFAGRRGCRMNACQVPDGGFMVWFTIPAR